MTTFLTELAHIYYMICNISLFASKFIVHSMCFMFNLINEKRLSSKMHTYKHFPAVDNLKSCLSSLQNIYLYILIMFQVCIPSNNAETFVGKTVTLAGWGKTGPKAEGSPVVLEISVRSVIILNLVAVGTGSLGQNVVLWWIL